MQPHEFCHHFRCGVRVLLNWKQFCSSDWPIEPRTLNIPRDSDHIFTPWYARDDDSVCSHNEPGAKPLSVATAARNQRLLKLYRILPTAPTEHIVAPAYQLPTSAILLLDGNHRAVSSQRAASNIQVIAFVINGPINEQVLPDLAHWA